MKGSDFPINVHVVPLLFNNRDILFKMNQIAFVRFIIIIRLPSYV